MSWTPTTQRTYGIIKHVISKTWPSEIQDKDATIFTISCTRGVDGLKRVDSLDRGWVIKRLIIAWYHTIYRSSFITGSSWCSPKNALSSLIPQPIHGACCTAQSVATGGPCLSMPCNTRPVPHDCCMYSWSPDCLSSDLRTPNTTSKLVNRRTKNHNLLPWPYIELSCRILPEYGCQTNWLDGPVHFVTVKH